MQRRSPILKTVDSFLRFIIRSEILIFYLPQRPTTLNTFKGFEATAWERKADRYDETWGSFTSQSIEAALDMAEVHSSVTLLDCGCGPGHLCFRALQRGAVVTGCDYSHKMLGIAQSLYPHINFCHADAEAIPFESNIYDAVILNYLLLHVASPDRALREAHRVLKPGGRLCLPRGSHQNTRRAWTSSSPLLNNTRIGR